MSRRNPRRRRLSPHRRDPRWQVPGARVAGPILTARVVDVGPGGAHLETATALRVGASYTFTLVLPGASRRLSGRIRWSRLVATRAGGAGDQVPVYRAGVTWRPRLVLPIFER